MCYAILCLVAYQAAEHFQSFPRSVRLFQLSGGYWVNKDPVTHNLKLFSPLLPYKRLLKNQNLSDFHHFLVGCNHGFLKMFLQQKSSPLLSSIALASVSRKRPKISGSSKGLSDSNNGRRKDGEESSTCSVKPQSSLSVLCLQQQFSS